MRTHRGKNIDMDQLYQENRKSVAVGNIPVNAQGDRIGKNGEVEQTVQQATKIFYKNTHQSEEATSLKDPVSSEETVAKSSKTKDSSPKKSKEIIEDNGDIIKGE